MLDKSALESSTFIRMQHGLYIGIQPPFAHEISLHTVRSLAHLLSTCQQLDLTPDVLSPEPYLSYDTSFYRIQERIQVNSNSPRYWIWNDIPTFNINLFLSSILGRRRGLGRALHQLGKTMVPSAARRRVGHYSRRSKFNSPRQPH